MIRGVYLVLDPDAVGSRASVRVAEAALLGGASAVQWRQKGGSISVRWSELMAVRDTCRRHSAPFLVNDRVDIALAVGADGVHVGQDDLPFEAARRLMPHGIIGLSVTNAAQVGQAAACRPAYIGAGPVFPTGSKAGAAPPAGLEMIRACAATGIPVVAIGGITSDNLASVVAAGAVAVAVISAICGASDPESATRELVATFTSARSGFVTVGEVIA